MTPRKVGPNSPVLKGSCLYLFCNYPSPSRETILQPLSKTNITTIHTGWCSFISMIAICVMCSGVEVGIQGQGSSETVIPTFFFNQGGGRKGKQSEKPLCERGKTAQTLRLLSRHNFIHPWEEEQHGGVQARPLVGKQNQQKRVFSAKETTGGKVSCVNLYQVTCGSFSSGG